MSWIIKLLQVMVLSATLCWAQTTRQIPIKGVALYVEALRAKTEELDAASKKRVLEQEEILLKDTGRLSWYDKLYNSLLLEVYNGKMYAEDVRLNGAPLLWHAVSKGKLNATKLLLYEYADLRVFRHGESLICRAAMSGNLDLLRMLDKDAFLTLNDRRCRSSWKGVCGILKRAAQSGNVECLRHIYEHTAWLSHVNPYYPCIIDNAGMSGSTATMEYLWGKGLGKRVNEIMLRASLSGNTQLVRRLIEKEGASPHYVGSGDYTPLMLAAMSGNYDLVSYLVKVHKVNVNARSRTGDSAAILAARSGKSGVLAFLISNKAAKDAVSQGQGDIVCAAAASGDVDTFEYALGQVQQSDKTSAVNRALCYAARHGHMTLASLLLDKHMADVNTVQTITEQHVFPYEDLVGDREVIEVETGTPLTAAIASGNLELVRLLVSRCACPIKCVSQNRFRNCALLAAVRRGQPGILNYLLPLVCMEEKDPALLNEAVQNGNRVCAEILLKRGWDVHAVDPQTNLSPVEAVCIRGSESPASVNWNYDSGSSHEACLQVLQKQGACTNVDNVRKATRLALNGEVPLFRCAAMLWQTGGNLTPEEMLYPLQVAAEFGDPEWTRILLPGLGAVSRAGNQHSPMFYLCNTADTYGPLDEKERRSSFILCGKILRDAGDSLTPEESSYIIRKGITYKLQHLLKAEPLPSAPASK